MREIAMMVGPNSAAEPENELSVVRLSMDLPAAAVSALEDIKQKFTNQRQWREFLSALQCTVNYPAVVHTLRSGKKWLDYRFSR